MEDHGSDSESSPEAGADRSSAPIRFVIDHRERSAGVLLALSGIEDVDVRVEHLPVGDYLVDDAFVFERKTLSDLAASIKDARLFKQECRLAEDSPRAALVLEGTVLDQGASAMRREAVQGALVCVTLMLGLPLLRSRDATETVHLKRTDSPTSSDPIAPRRNAASALDRERAAAERELQRLEAELVAIHR